MSIRLTAYLIFAVLLMMTAALLGVIQWAENNEYHIAKTEKLRFQAFQTVEELWHIADVRGHLAEAYCDTADPKWRRYYDTVNAVNRREITAADLTGDAYVDTYVDGLFDKPHQRNAPRDVTPLTLEQLTPDERAALLAVREAAMQIAVVEQQVMAQVAEAGPASAPGATRLTVANPVYHARWTDFARAINHFLHLLHSNTSQQILQTRARGHMIHTIGLVLGSIGLFCVVGAFVLLHMRIIRPIRRLEQAAIAVGQGDYSTRTGIARHDELGRLAGTFDRMAAAIANDIRVLEENERQIRQARDEIKQSLHAAANVQQAILPKQLPTTTQAEFAWVYEPAEELAGDALLVQQVNDRYVAMYVLDASGHGVTASLLSVSISRYLRAADTNLMGLHSPETEPTAPAEVVSQLNRLFPMEQNDNHFFTMVYAIFDLETQQMRYITAGHPGPIIFHADGTYEILDAPNLPVGVMEDAQFTEAVAPLRPGDRVLLYSDGLFEAANEENEMIGRERVARMLSQTVGEHLDDDLGQLMAYLHSWVPGDSFEDDVSIIAVRWK